MKALREWQGEKELPEIGKHYFASEKIMIMGGRMTFPDRNVALRYEGSFKGFKAINPRMAAENVHVFKAPVVEKRTDAVGPPGDWVTYHFYTSELHETYDVDWDNEDCIYLGPHGICHHEGTEDSDSEGEEEDEGE